MNNPKKATLLILIIGIIGSIVTFYGTNFVIEDVANYTYGFNGLNFFSTIPTFCLSLIFTDLIILVIRYYIRPNYKKRTLLLHLTVMLGFSIIGLIGSILTSIFVYDSLFTHFPYFAYPIVNLILYTVLIIVFIISKSKVKKNMPEDPEIKKFKISYMLYSTILSLITFFALNRLGALLLSPMYIQARTLYMTWPLYIWLTSPILLLVYVVLNSFNIFYNLNDKITYIVVYLIFNTVLAYVIYTTGINNSLFLSAISPAFGLDRIGTFPYDAILQFVETTVFALYFLFRSLYLKFIKHEK